MSTVELIYDADCPNVASVREQLLRAFTSTGLVPQWREWDRGRPESPAYARKYGSPTILIDGKDVAGEEPAVEASCCRVYTHAGGRAAGVPALEQIQSSLLRIAASSAAGGGDRSSRWTTWKNSAPALPGIGLALLPKLTCAACWPAYAGLLSALGVGFIDYTPYLLALTVLFLLVTLGSLAYRARKRRGYWPFALGTIAAIVVLIGKFALDSDVALYSGITALVAVSLWNAWPKA